MSLRSLNQDDRTYMQEQTAFYQLSGTTALLLLVGFYGLTFLMSLMIGKKKENVDSYMVSNNAVASGSRLPV